jgi:hypothetical protein
MRKIILAACFPLLAFTAIAADRPWQQITVPSASQAAANFATPPAEYGMVLWWFWNGQMAESNIIGDLDELHSHGVTSVIIWAYYGLQIDYLSDTWFARVQFAVAAARDRGMRVWIADEGSYPSGFAGGAFTNQYPLERMKALVAVSSVTASGGKAVAVTVSAQDLSAWATNTSSGAVVTLPIVNGQINWTPPSGTWQIKLVEWQYRTPATRYVGSPGFAKNTTYSMFDFLNPDDTRQFLAIVHQRYQNVIGDEFGKTVLGFRGDEPDCYPVPWTDQSLADFQSSKGYDLTPLLPDLLAPNPTVDAHRVQADYWDVWSALLRENFYRVQADWCAANGMEYVVHLNNDDSMPALVPLSGDFFRALRYVQVPGVDTIWRQIWPGTIADFPKRPSSATHLNGHPRAFTESYAVYGRGLTLEQAKWVMDFQFVRGINFIENMSFFSDSSQFREYFCPPDWRLSPQWQQFPMFAQYANRASYLLSIGTPAASVALFEPTANLWLGDTTADAASLKIARQLLESQQDFDFIDEQALTGTATVVPGGLRNLSGQLYRAVVVPPGSVLSSAALNTLQQFNAAGGTVIFAGSRPQLTYDQTFRNAYVPQIGWGVLDPNTRLDALPPSDVQFSAPAPAIKYLHRRWQDADLYFFFNESASAQQVEAVLSGTGKVQDWDPETGAIRGLAPGSAAGGVPLRLDPYGTRFVVIGASPASLALPLPMPAGHATAAAVPGPWQLQIGQSQLTTPLMTWQALGMPQFWGAATYTTEFTSNFEPGTSLTLDLGQVLYSAHVWVNGNDLGARAWRPFTWDVTGALQPCNNQIVVEVRNTPANELSGDPVRLAQVQALGWLQGSYYSTYSPFDVQMVPSGLIGPVQIEAPQYRQRPVRPPARHPKR